MAKIAHGDTSQTTPEWMADFGSRDHLIPGGVRLDPAAFPAVDGVVHVPGGTVIGRTIAERDAGAPFGPVAFTAGTSVDDDEVYLLAFDVSDAAKDADGVLYRPGSVVKENYLPGWAGLDPVVQAEIRDRYLCQIGAE